MTLVSMGLKAGNKPGLLQGLLPTPIGVQTIEWGPDVDNIRKYWAA